MIKGIEMKATSMFSSLEWMPMATRKKATSSNTYASITGLGFMAPDRTKPGTLLEHERSDPARPESEHRFTNEKHTYYQYSRITTHYHHSHSQHHSFANTNSMIYHLSTIFFILVILFLPKRVSARKNGKTRLNQKNKWRDGTAPAPCEDIRASCSMINNNADCYYDPPGERYGCHCVGPCQYRDLGVLDLCPDRDFFPDLEKSEHYFECRARPGHSENLYNLRGTRAQTAFSLDADMLDMYILG